MTITQLTDAEHDQLIHSSASATLRGYTFASVRPGDLMTYGDHEYRVLTILTQPQEFPREYQARLVAPEPTPDLTEGVVDVSALFE